MHMKKSALHPASVKLARGPAADAVPGHYPPHLSRASTYPSSFFFFWKPFITHVSLICPLLKEIMDRIAGALHHGRMLEEGVALDLDSGRRVVVYAAVK